MADAPALSTGEIISAYPYLWLWQRDRFETEGRKERPVCVAVAVKGVDGLTHLALLAITGTPPRADQRAVEIPPLEIRRIGLKEHKQAWIIVSEYNYDILEKSFSLDIRTGRKETVARFSQDHVARIPANARIGAGPHRPAIVPQNPPPAPRALRPTSPPCGCNWDASAR